MIFRYKINPQKLTTHSKMTLVKTTPSTIYSSLQHSNFRSIKPNTTLSFQDKQILCNGLKQSNPIYTSYSKLSEVKLLTIGIASPLRILQWAEKTLPNGKIYGEVLNANTLHHKTFKPQKGGLFCERIFGPLKDFECACGKVDKSVKQELSNSLFRSSTEMTGTENLQNDKTTEKSQGSLIFSSALTKESKTLDSLSNKRIQIRKFCPVCDVEYTWSVIRRYQLGYIKLISPVTHLWFLKGTPSYLSLLLDIKKRHLQFVTYCSETFTLENSFSQNTKGILMESPSKIFESWKNIVENQSQGFKQTPGKTQAINSFSLSVNTKNQKRRVFKEKQAVPNKQWKYTSQLFELTNSSKKEQKTNSAFLSNKTLVLFEPNEHQNILNMNLTDLNTMLKNDNLPVNEILSEKVNNNYLSNLVNQASSHSFQSDLVSMKERIKTTNKSHILYFNTQNSVSIQNTFALTTVLNALQISIYYKYFCINKQNQDDQSFQKNLSNLDNNLLSSTSAFNLNVSKKGTKLNAMLYKISQKLPIESYILCTLEQKMQRKALLLAINTTWDLMYKKAYIYALQKVEKVQSKYQMSSQMTLKIEPILRNNKNIQPYSFSVLTQSEAFLPVLNQSKMIQKNMVYKVGKDTLTLLLKNLKRKYSHYVFKTLKQNKHILFSSNYTTLSQKNTTQIIATVAKDIEELLLNEGSWVQKLLCQSIFKYLLFGTYLENMKFENLKETMNNLNNVNNVLSSSKNPNILAQNKIDDGLKETKKTISILSKYAQFLEIKKRQTSETDIFISFTSSFAKGLAQKTKTLPLNKPLKVSANKFENSYKETQKIFNTVYSLSHRERWETEKDWYIFSLFNSASVEYLDTPIFAYKKRLFSYSFDFMHDSAFTNDLSMNNKFLNLQEVVYSSSFYSGPGIVKQLLNEFDFNEIQKLDKQNRLLLYQLNKSIFKLKKQVQVFVYDKLAKNELKELCKKRDLLIRRTKLVRKLFRKNTDPSSMILTVLPVLPPDLRPIVKMGGQIAASDLNRLYQRVIYRNERLKKFLKDPATSQSYEMKYAQRLLQESVDNLIQNGKSGMNSEKDARGRALKSLSDSLKGKQGRFRQFLLGKRVDYSGRSVIVVGPKLKLHECGLPIEMAKELYLPFLLKMILNKNYAKTVIGAKALIRKNPALTSELLREIMQVSPVLLNRAPTLHRLGFQAFVPKLIEGRAILLHPLVCSAFNADFDGDQMAVHVPITIEARAEAWKLMLSRNNILSPATGEPLAIPSQDMVLGCYYLTTYANKGAIPLLNGSGIFFNNFEDVLRAYYQQKISVHALIWVKWTGLIENGSDQEEPVEIRLNSNGQWQEISANYYRIYDSNNLLVTQYVATTPGRIFFNSYIKENMK